MDTVMVPHLVVFLVGVIAPLFLLCWGKYKAVWVLLVVVGVLTTMASMYNYCPGCGNAQFLLAPIAPILWAMPSVVIYWLVLAIKRYRDKEYKNEKGYQFLRDYGVVFVITVILYVVILKFLGDDKMMKTRAGATRVGVENTVWEAREP